MLEPSQFQIQNKVEEVGGASEGRGPKLIIKLLGSVSDEKGQKIGSFCEVGSR
jgi:hypothetical protein